MGDAGANAGDKRAAARRARQIGLQPCEAIGKQ